MNERGLGRRFAKNLVLAFAAQGISFLFSALMALIVPKLLGVEQYAYWQLFIFYGLYVSLFHFGLSDGVYLKYGGTELERMDKEIIGAQFRFMVLWQCLLSALVLPVLLFLTKSPERQFVWILTVVYLIVGNATWYFGFVFQAANRTSVYSVSVIITKVLCVFFIICTWFMKVKDFRPYIVTFVIAQSISLIYVLYNAKSFLLIKMPKAGRCLKELRDNIRIGIHLTISNHVSSLILGIGRIMVDHAQGISSFGLLSLSVSLTNFFLQFVAQVSMVLFPALRQVEQEKAKKYFLVMRTVISYPLCGILAFYLPAKWILGKWIPQYEESLRYMIFLLPICVFDGKMQMIYNTYLKVWRRERQLLYFNLASLALSTVLCAVSAFAIREIMAVALAMMVAIMFRSVAAGYYLSKVLDVSFDRNLIWEMALAAVFVISNLFMAPLPAFFAYLALYLIYVIIMRKDIVAIGDLLRNR